jgi:predicted PurR-regulated permease PerM
MQEKPSTPLPLVKYLQLCFFAGIILYWGKTLFIPLFYGLLIALVMYPISKWFEKKGWGKVMAISACMGIVTVLLLALFGLLVWQANVLAQQAPQVLNKASVAVQQLQGWLHEKMGLALGKEYNWAESLSNNMGGLAKSVFRATTGTLFMLFIVPVFTALFMYHRKTFVQYLKLVTPTAYRQQVDTVLQQVIHTYFNYIKGMLLVYLLVGILNSIGLWALGVDNAILFGMLCAIMTIVPYIGIFVSALLPISVVWLQTGNIWYPIGVVAVFSTVQYLEANVIFPKVVGAQLHVSTMAMLVAIIVGGIIWGISGMILFIPFVAILKIISDNIADWKPLNVLLSR